MIINEVMENSVCVSHVPVVKVRSGASIVKIKPLFTYDSKNILIVSGCDVKVFSVSSGECTLTFKRHKSPVVSLQANKKNNLQVLSCSEDGTVIRWDYSDGKALKQYKLRVQSKISAYFAPTAEGPWFVTTMIEGTDHHRLYSVTMRATRSSKIHMVMRPVLPAENAIAFGPEGSYIAAIHENSLLLHDLNEKIDKRHKTGERQLTCVACHPSDYIVATGDSDGRIIVWSGMLESNQPTRSMYHWHSLPLADVIFSIEGSHVYSGGGECVLVKWNLNTGTKHTLPRLGLPICRLAVSPDNSYIATGHTDNALQIVSSYNNVVQIIQGLTQGHSQNTKDTEILPTGMQYDPRTSAIVLNGRPGHLQFYNIHDDKQLFQLDIVGRNYISQEKESVVFNTDVEKAAIDDKGLWLATVECRDDGETSPEIRLKFWLFDLMSQQFVLNTNVFLPHNKKVNCLKFRPQIYLEEENDESIPLAVTTSNDNRFKIWTLSDKSDKKLSWSCELMGYYKELAAGDACFSEDGSLLAVIFDYVITLWTPDTNVLKASLCNPITTNSVRCVHFGRDRSSHLLVCHTDEMLTVWNVLTLSILWNVKCDIQYLVADPLLDIMASFTKDGNLYLFQTSNPKPILMLKNVSSSLVISAIFVPRVLSQADRAKEDLCCWQCHSQLFFLNEDQVLLTVTDDSIESNKEEDTEKIVFSKGQPVTPFGLLHAEHTVSDVKPVKPKLHVISDTDKDDNELPCPTNVNPISLCEAVLSNLLQPYRKGTKNKDTVKTEAPSVKCEYELYSGLTATNKQPGNTVSNQDVTNTPKMNSVVLDDYSFLLEFVT